MNEDRTTCETCGADLTRECAVRAMNAVLWAWVCNAPGCTHSDGKRGQTLAEGGRGGAGGKSRIQRQELVYTTPPNKDK